MSHAELICICDGNYILQRKKKKNNLSEALGDALTPIEPWEEFNGKQQVNTSRICSLFCVLCLFACTKTTVEQSEVTRSKETKFAFAV